jgi:hypothetical protein
LERVSQEGGDRPHDPLQPIQLAEVLEAENSTEERRNAAKEERPQRSKQHKGDDLHPTMTSIIYLLGDDIE